MQWISISEAMLNDAKAAPLIAAVANTNLAAGQGDPIPNLVASIAEEIRGAIGFAGKYQVSATVLTIPPNLKDMAVQKCVRICKRRLEQTLTQDERDEESTYQKRLGLIREGKWPVDNPDDPIAVNPSTPFGKVSSFQPYCRQYDHRHTQNL